MSIVDKNISKKITWECVYRGDFEDSPEVTEITVAEGISEIYDIKYIERGYEDFPEKLRKLGAEIEVIDTEQEKRRFQFRVG